MLHKRRTGQKPKLAKATNQIVNGLRPRCNCPPRTAHIVALVNRYTFSCYTERAGPAGGKATDPSTRVFGGADTLAQSGAALNHYTGVQVLDLFAPEA